MRRRRIQAFWGTVLLLAIVGGLAVFFYRRHGDDETAVPTFVGKSFELKNTVFVPSLETLLEANKSAVWCASLQLAWNQLRDKVVKGPVKLQGGGELVDQLNSSPITATVFAEGDCFAEAGLVRDGVRDRIRAAMRERFPDVRVDLGASSDQAALAYAYCAMKARFRIPYFPDKTPVQFRAEGQPPESVRSFGTVPPGGGTDGRSLREQLDVLYMSEKTPGEGQIIVVREFILDLDDRSGPYQFVIARVDRESTLSRSLEKIRRLQEKYREAKVVWGLSDHDEFHMPQMAWDVEVDHESLRGARLLGPPLDGLPLAEVAQSIKFSLNRHGMEMASGSRIVVGSTGEFHPGSYRYVCDRPFFVIVTKRGEKFPCFVMWVENAELLTPW